MRHACWGRAVRSLFDNWSIAARPHASPQSLHSESRVLGCSRSLRTTVVLVLAKFASCAGCEALHAASERYSWTIPLRHPNALRRPSAPIPCWILAICACPGSRIRAYSSCSASPATWRVTNCCRPSTTWPTAACSLRVSPWWEWGAVLGATTSCGPMSSRRCVRAPAPRGTRPSGISWPPACASWNSPPSRMTMPTPA